MIKFRISIALFFFFVLLGALYLSFFFPREAKVFPLLVLIPSVPLAALNIYSEGRNSKSARGDVFPSSFLLVFCGVLLFILCGWLLGITAGLPFALFLYLKILSRETWKTAIVSTFLGWIVLYFGFEVILRQSFEKGILWSFFFLE